MRSNLFKSIALAMHSVIVIMGSITIFMQAFFSPDRNNRVSTSGVDIFRFFTIDGNIFIVFSSIVVIGYIITSFFKEIKNYKVAYVIELMGVVSALLIFLTVVFILLPAYGTSLLKGYKMIVLHATNPILCCIAFLLFNEENISKRLSLLGIVPMSLYGVVALTLCFTKVWTGYLIPYPFLRVYQNPWWETLLYLFIMYGGSIGLSILLSVLSPKLCLINKSNTGIIIIFSITFMVIIGLTLLLILV